MTFFKTNSKLLLKALLYQIVFSIFGNMMALGTLSSDTLLVAGSIIIIGLYMYMVFTSYHEAGLKIAVSRHDKSKDMLNAVLVAVIPFIPALIVGLLSSLGGLYYPDGSYTSRFATLQIQRLLFTGEYVGIFQVVFPPEETYDAYNNLVSSMTHPSQPIAFFLAAIPQIFAAFIGMVLGLKEITFKKKDDQEG